MSAKIALVADFTADSLATILNNRGAEVILAPFGKVEAALLDEADPIWKAKPDFAVVWTRPERVVATFARRAAFEEAAMSEILADVDRFATSIERAAARVKGLFVPSWVRSPEARGLGVGDMNPTSGVAGALALMNARLVERLADVRGAHVLDAARWIAISGRSAMSAKLWYGAKTPYSLGVFQTAATDVLAAIAALVGRSRRLLILDLDDTLWGNVVGEDGKEGLRLGGHDAVGEAFVDFQRGLEALARRGVLLAIASKNDEAVAVDTIETHPEMILRRRAFAAVRIGWGDKAESVASIARELNLGLESVVFIDDSAAERARVREAFPAVLVPEWPIDPLLFRTALDALDCFDAAALTREDRARSAVARHDDERRAGAREAPSLEAWLESLATEVVIEPFSPANAPRIAQLFAKTNQMNLTSRRLTEVEIGAWLGAGERELLAFRVRDRLGDAGLVGVIAIDVGDRDAVLTDFLLSCRVFGRRIEHAMLGVAITRAKKRGAARLTARLVATARNLPCRDFFVAVSVLNDDDAFVFSTDAPIEMPKNLRLIGV